MTNRGEPKASFFTGNAPIVLALAIVSISAIFLGGVLYSKVSRSKNRTNATFSDDATLPTMVKVAPSGSQPIFSIGFMPSSSIEQVHLLSAAIASRLSQTENIIVRSIVGASYGDLADAIRDSEVDAAFLSPVLFVSNGFEKTHSPLFRILRKGPNPDAYFGSFIVKSSNKRIRKLSDICNTSVGYSDPESSSGYVYPKRMLLLSLQQNGKLKKCKIRETFFNGHKGVLEAVSRGEVDVGATFANDATGKSGAWNQLGHYSVRVVAISESIPSDGFFVRKSANAEIVEKVRHSFFELITSSEGRELAERLFRAQTFVPASEKDYAQVSKVMDELRLLEQERLQN